MDKGKSYTELVKDEEEKLEKVGKLEVALVQAKREREEASLARQLFWERKV